jgi:putative transposase
VKELQSHIQEEENVSLRRQCELLGVSRSSLYYQAKEESEENLMIMKKMDAESLQHPTHGVLQMVDFLFIIGFFVNPKRARRLLRKMRIWPIFPKRNLSKLGQAQYVRPYLLRNLKVEQPNQVWAIDITYVPMAKGFMYLTAIIDHYSRYVVAWDVFNSLDAANSLSVLQKAIEIHGKPEIINSDQGSQFTCHLWIDFCDTEKITVSMDGAGRAIDNIFIERLWRTVKQDYVYLYPASDGVDLFQGLRTFFDYYNHQKSHQGIDRKTPGSLYLPAA